MVKALDKWTVLCYTNNTIINLSPIVEYAPVGSPACAEFSPANMVIEKSLGVGEGLIKLFSFEGLFLLCWHIVWKDNGIGVPLSSKERNVFF